MTNETGKLIEEALEVMHCLGIDNLRAKGAIILLTEALRRAETERDAQAKEFARFKAVAALANSVVRWDSLLNEMHEQKARAQRAEQERDAQAAMVEKLTAERDELEELARRRLYRLSEIGQLVGAKLGQSTERAVKDALAEARECASGQQRRADALQRKIEALEQSNARLTAERDEAREAHRRLFVQSIKNAETTCDLVDALDETQAQVWGLICVATNGQWRERDQTERTQRNLSFMGACLDEEQRKVEELTATRDLLTAENARLQKERDAARVVHACPPKGSGVMPCCGATPFEKQGEWLTVNPALVNCDRQRLIAENARLRAEVSTLELLRRGGK